MGFTFWEMLVFNGISKFIGSVTLSEFFNLSEPQLALTLKWGKIIYHSGLLGGLNEMTSVKASST